MTYATSDTINLSDYPIATPGNARQAALGDVRKALARDGCAVLKGFLTPQGVAALAQEADGVAG